MAQISANYYSAEVTSAVSMLVVTRYLSNIIYIWILLIVNNGHM